MGLPDAKQLDSILKVLRKHGVLQYQSTELNLVLSDSPPAYGEPIKSQAEQVMSSMDDGAVDEIERLLNYSAASPLEDIK